MIGLSRGYSAGLLWIKRQVKSVLLVFTRVVIFCKFSRILEVEPVAVNSFIVVSMLLMSRNRHTIFAFFEGNSEAFVQCFTI